MPLPHQLRPRAILLAHTPSPQSCSVRYELSRVPRLEMDLSIAPTGSETFEPRRITRDYIAKIMGFANRLRSQIRSVA